MNTDEVRRQFPSLSLRENGQPVVFFDNPAGTQVPQRVIDRVANYWRTSNANHGGVFATSQRSDALIDEARNAAAAFFNADGPDEVVFGANMTTITYAVSRAMGRDFQEGDEIVVSGLEHDANVSPWATLAERGVVIRHVDVDLTDCTLDMQDLNRKVSSHTRLVAVTHASNAVGTIPDMREIGRIAHAAGAWFWVDAVHYAPHGLIDVKAIDCDFLVCSAYKFYGPHVGLLYGRRELLSELRPYQLSVSRDELPGRWEVGAQSYEGIAGVLGAFEYIASLSGSTLPTRAAFEASFEVIREHESELVVQLLAGLARIPGVDVYGITQPDRVVDRTPTVSLTLKPHTPRDLARHLSNHQVFTWFGHYGAASLIEQLGLKPDGALRIGIASYNTASEVDLLLEVLAGLSN